MTMGLADTIRNNRLTQILNAIDAGAGAGFLRIYDGTRPSKGGTVTTLLAELTFSDPSGTVSGGVLTFNAVNQDPSANATGTATWARIVDSTGAFVADLSVGTSGQDVNLNSTSIATGQVVQITSATITEGNA